MSKPAAQLDREIAELIMQPRLGDPAWEAAWTDLLTEKHSKARVPTINELAHAFAYIEAEYIIKDGRINSEQWADGLAFGQRCTADVEATWQAKEALKQLAPAAWLRIAERANYLAREQGDVARYLKQEVAP